MSVYGFHGMRLGRSGNLSLVHFDDRKWHWNLKWQPSSIKMAGSDAGKRLKHIDIDFRIVGDGVLQENEGQIINRSVK